MPVQYRYNVIYFRIIFFLFPGNRLCLTRRATHRTRRPLPPREPKSMKGLFSSGGSSRSQLKYQSVEYSAFHWCILYIIYWCIFIKKIFSSFKNGYRLSCHTLELDTNTAFKSTKKFTTFKTRPDIIIIFIM